MRWVALLRAVNLGARNKVPMAQLRALLEEAGYANVRTFIASGNVLLEGPRSRPKVAAELERLIADAFGVDTTAILRTPAELEAVVTGHPFGADTSHSHVVFLATKPGREAAERLAGVDASPDRAELVGQDVYLRYSAGVQGSRFSAARLERLLEVRATHRNWRTVAALAELAADA
ncbi:MAG: DUF1697 domain-containing protein [Gaiellaceae bacterium]